MHYQQSRTDKPNISSGEGIPHVYTNAGSSMGLEAEGKVRDIHLVEICKLTATSFTFNKLVVISLCNMCPLNLTHLAYMNFFVISLAGIRHKLYK